MKPGFFASQAALKNKPPHGQACTQCGLCCRATICPLGQHIFKRGRLGPCPALEFDSENKSRCGVVEHPMKYAMRLCFVHSPAKMSAAAKWLIGASTGCDARFNGEPPDYSFYRYLERWDKEHANDVREAKRLWGIK